VEQSNSQVVSYGRGSAPGLVADPLPGRSTSSGVGEGDVLVRGEADWRSSASCDNRNTLQRDAIDRDGYGRRARCDVNHHVVPRVICKRSRCWRRKWGSLDCADRVEGGVIANREVRDCRVI
jgi:hypothetical protein